MTAEIVKAVTIAKDMDINEYKKFCYKGVTKADVEAKYNEFIGWCREHTVPVVLAMSVDFSTEKIECRSAFVGDVNHVTTMVEALVHNANRMLEEAANGNLHMEQ